MCKKLLTSFLLVALFNLFVSCSSSAIVTPAEFNDIEKDERPNELIIKTNDNWDFYLSNSNYEIKNDSLFWQEQITNNEMWIPFDGKIAFNEIKEVEYYNNKNEWTYTLSISEYKKIEEENGKSDEIFVLKNDSTKYYFKDGDYHLDKDTLIGNGKLFLIENEQIITKSIALSDIKSFEYDYVSLMNRIFRGVVFFSIVFIGLLFLLVVTWPGF
jgi:hypothetical protein